MTQKPSAAMSNAGFVHLHVHSAYSLLKGSIKIQKLGELAKADRQPALALTDTDNMFGALEFSDKMAGYGIQPIIGCELAVDFGDQDPNARNALAAAPARIVLLAARERGYRSLMRLNSRAFLETPVHQAPHIKFEWLQGDAEDLIALTGGPDGPISLAIHADHAGLAATRCDRLASLFGDRLYVELQRHGIEKERRAEAGLIDLAYTKGLPLVATNEPYFATTDDYEAHDALLCIAGGRLIADTERDQLTPDHRFKTRAEMAVLFADVPEALASTIEIAERCAFRPVTRKPILPRFTVGAGSQCRGCGERRGGGIAPPGRGGPEPSAQGSRVSQGTSEEDYRARLAFELDVITRMNYAGYFLIVADFIKWAKAEGIPVGTGPRLRRGLAGRLCLTITDLDPIRFGLLFERFLNPERVSMPDFDIDFCQDRRDEVIDYVQQRYGRDQVAQIITFGTLQARGVLRDVGRVLQMPYGQVDKLTKLVPQNPAAPVTLAAAIASEPKLQAFRDEDPVVARAFDIAQRLEGLTRHASTHAAGIVIGDRPLSELVPLYRDPKSDMPVTQFNMKWVEPAGLVKFDFLGLKTLTVLDRRGEAAQAARHRRRSGDAAARRCAKLPDAGAGRCGRRVPGGKPGHAARAGRHAARPLRGHHRAGGAVSARPDGEHSDLLRPQAWRRGAGIPASDARADPEGDLRRHHLPGTGDADRAGDGRLFARRSRSVAPGDGQEDPLGDGEAARALRLRRDQDAACPQGRRTPSSNCWRSSPTMASTRAMPRPTRCCPITPPT